MPRIRLLYLINNLKPGGAQRYIIDVLNSIDEDIYDVRLVSLGAGNFFANETNVPIIELGIEKNDPKPFALLKLLRIIREFSPHILHTHLQYADTVGQFIGRMLSVPVIVTTIHNSVEWPRERHTILTAIEDLALQRAERIIAVSQSLKTFLINNRNARADKITVLPCGVDLDQFFRAFDRHDRLRRQFGYDDQTVVFACTAHFRPEKRHDLLLQRFASLKKTVPTPLKLLLIGATGVLANEMHALVENLHLQDTVIICGGDRAKVSEYLAASDVYVMHSEFEGTSLAVAEAMAAGLPVLLPRLPHFTQQANEGEHGLFFDFEREEDFLRAAQMLVQDAALRVGMGNSARTHAMEMYGITSHIHKLVNIYGDMVSMYVYKKHRTAFLRNE